MGRGDAHLVDPKGGERSRHDAGPSQDVPPVEEVEGEALHNAVEPEAHHGHEGQDLDANGGAGGLLSHGAKQKLPAACLTQNSIGIHFSVTYSKIVPIGGGLARCCDAKTSYGLLVEGCYACCFI